MADLSTLSDADLLKLREQAAAAPAAVDLSSKTDEELQAMRAQAAATESQTTKPGGLKYLGGRFMETLLGIADAVEKDQMAPIQPFLDQKVQDALAQKNSPREFNKATFGAPQIEPANTFERYAGEVAAAAGNPISYVAPGVSAVGALAGEGAADLNRAVGSPIPELAARIGGNLVGGGVYGAGKAVARTAGIKQPADIAAARAELEAAGVSPVLKSDLKAGQPGFVDWALDKLSGAVGKRVNKQTEALGKASDDALTGAGATTKADAGQTILNAADRWRKGFHAEANKAFDEVRALVPEQLEINTGELGQIVKAPSSISNPAVAARANAPLRDYAGMFYDEAGAPRKMTYADLNEVRRQLGRDIENTMEPATRRELTQFRDKVVDSMDRSLRDAGYDDAANSWMRAREMYKAGKTFEEDVLSKLDNKNAAQAFDYATGQVSKSDERLNDLARFMTEQERRGLGATFMRDKATTDKGTDIDRLTRLLNDRNKLSPEARASMLDNLTPEQRDSLLRLDRLNKLTAMSRKEYGGETRPMEQFSRDALTLGATGLGSIANPAVAAGIPLYLGAKGVANAMTTPTGAALRANNPGLANYALTSGLTNAPLSFTPPPLPGPPMPSLAKEEDFNDWTASTQPGLVALHLGRALGPDVKRRLDAVAGDPEAFRAQITMLKQVPEYRRALSPAVTD